MTADAVAHPDLPAEPTWLQTFGASISAVFGKEARWRMRGRRAFVVISVYLLLLALLVVLVYQMIYEQSRWQFTPDGDLVRLDYVPGSVSAVIGQAIWTVVLVVQMTLTMLVAPALTAGAISMEREKQTLELLITTPVSTLGMVVGKLLSSLTFMFLLTLASVPLMSVVFAFGGIAPDDVVRSYVMLFAVGFGLGAIGLVLSALIKRTQVATALAYVILFILVIGSLIAYAYMAANVARDFRRPEAMNRPPPEVLLWLNPVVATIDLGCTAIPQSGPATCAFISGITGHELGQANPPRDAFWPRSALAFLAVGVGATLLTTQLIAPSRRIRRQRSRTEIETTAD